MKRTTLILSVMAFLGLCLVIIGASMNPNKLVQVPLGMTALGWGKLASEPVLSTTITPTETLWIVKFKMPNSEDVHEAYVDSTSIREESARKRWNNGDEVFIAYHVGRHHIDYSVLAHR